VLYGGMQDWNYLWTGDMELTIELSYRKWPDAEDLPGFWQANKQSLLSYIELVRTTGVRGIVRDDTSLQAIREFVVVVLLLLTCFVEHCCLLVGRF
jgi:hypothetical protein